MKDVSHDVPHTEPARSPSDTGSGRLPTQGGNVPAVTPPSQGEVSVETPPLNWGELSVMLLYPLLLILLLAGLRHLTGRLDKRLDRFREASGRSLHIFGFELLSAQHTRLLAASLLRSYKIALYLLSAYLFTMVFFSFFPYTRTIAHQMFGFIVAPFLSFLDLVLDFIPMVVAAAVTFPIAGVVMRFVDFLLLKEAHELSRLPFLSEEVLTLIDKLAKPMILVGGILFVLSYMPGIGGKIVTYSLVGIGVLIIVSLLRISENIVADIIVSYLKPFQENDTIQIGEFSGEVVNRNFLGVKVRTSDDDEILIPNRNFLQSSFLRKVSDPQPSRMIHIAFTHTAEVDPKRIQLRLIEAIRQTEGIDLRRPYKVLITDIQDTQISYKLSASHTESADGEEVKSDLFFKIFEIARSTT